VTPEGAFDFIFNIYYPSGHSINRNGVPENFKPLEPFYLDEDVFHLDYEPGDYVASPSVQEPDLDASRFVFSTPTLKC
jgi:hypothetical protein